MNCVKCGRETGEGQVFCQECLLQMDQYPVKPGTAVRLPRRREENAAKKMYIRRKPQLSPEEQLKILKKRARILFLSLMAALILLAVTGYYTVSHLLEDQGKFLPGQNYSAITSTEPVETD